ncbi:hypothetical protein KC333_g6634 [Hortaea werneckii]|nr:hypothetical protein KC333_g6634 [Hortaea werneckii]KAI7308496.1 hypothetical protein KC326_g7390 [Hortaea werneckii]
MIKTTYVYTQTSPPETSSTYEVSYRISVYTSNVGRYDHRNVGTTTLTTSRWDCQFSSCAPDAVSTVLTSEFYSSHDLTTAITVKQAYAVNGTASAYTTIPAETKTFTTRVDYLSAPYTEPRPTCSPSSTTQCIFSKDCSKCTISGGTVQLLYFPVSRTSATASVSSFVSGSKGKATGQAGWNRTASATKDPEGVMTSAPSTLSDPLFPVPVTSAYLKAASFNLADLNWPVPVSAYQNQPKFKLGGEIFSVVFDDYRPVLAVPPQIREMDPAWKTCELDWEGLYDPPKALQPARTMAGVTTPTGEHPASDHHSLGPEDLDASRDTEGGSVMADPTTDPEDFVSSRRPSSGFPSSVGVSSNQNMPLSTKGDDDPGADDSQIVTGPSIATSTIRFGTTKNHHEGTVNVPDHSFEMSTPSMKTESSQLETKTLLTKSVVIGSISSGSEESPKAGGLAFAETSGPSKSHQDPVATAIIAGLGADNVGGGGKTVGEIDPSNSSSKGSPGSVGDLDGSTVEQTAANQAAKGTSRRGTSAVDGQIVQTVAGDHSDVVSQTSGSQGGDSEDMSTPTHTTDPGENNRLPFVASPSSEQSDTVATVTIAGQPYTATKADSDVVIVNHRTISAGGSGLPIPHATLTVAYNGELQMLYTKTQLQNSKDHQLSETETHNKGGRALFPLDNSNSDRGQRNVRNCTGT